MEKEKESKKEMESMKNEKANGIKSIKRQKSWEGEINGEKGKKK